MADPEKRYKIIIVDDDDFLVGMYSTKFQGSGVDVVVFKSGDALLEKLKTGEMADLILLDVVIPGTDGISTLRIIREQKFAEGVPIVMLTNQNDERDIEEAKKLGVAGYIVKSAATPSEVVKESISIIKNLTK